MEEKVFTSEAIGVPVAEEVDPSVGKRWHTFGKWCILALIFLAPIFFLPYTHAPIETSKFLIAAVLLGGAAIGFCVEVLRRREAVMPFGGVGAAIFALFLAVGASTIFSKAPFISLHGNFLAADSFMAFVFLGLAFFLSAHFFSSKDLGIVSASFYGGVGLAAIFWILGRFHLSVFPWEFTKVSEFSTAGTPFLLAMLLSTLLVSALAAASLGVFSKIYSRSAYAIAGVAFIALVILNNQATWFAVAVALAILAAASFARGGPFLFFSTTAVVATALAFSGSLFSPDTVELSSVLKPGFSDTLFVVRETLSGWRGLLGVGPAIFRDAFNEAGRPSGLLASDAWSSDFAQGSSFVVTLLPTTGFVGFFAFCALLFFAVKKVYEAAVSGDYEAVAVAVPVLILGAYLFFFPGFFLQLLLIFLGLGFLVSLRAPKKRFSFDAVPPMATAAAFSIFLLLVGVGAWSAFLFGERYAAAVRFGASLEYIALGKGGEAVSAIGAAVALDSGNDEYLRTASQIFASYALWVSTEKGSEDEIQQSASRAVDLARRATDVNSMHASNWSNLGNVYERLVPLAQGAHEHAYKNYAEARKRDPRNPQLPLDMARALLLSRQVLSLEKQKEVLGLIAQSIELKPDYAPPRLFLAQLQFGGGANEEGGRTLEELAALRPQDAAVAYQVGLLYYQGNRFREAQAHLERAVSLDYSVASARYVLGLVYERQGERGKAEKELREILRIDPQNAEAMQMLEGFSAEK